MNAIVRFRALSTKTSSSRNGIRIGNTKLGTQSGDSHLLAFCLGTDTYGLETDTTLTPRSGDRHHAHRIRFMGTSQWGQSPIVRGNGGQTRQTSSSVRSVRQIGVGESMGQAASVMGSVLSVDGLSVHGLSALAQDRSDKRSESRRQMGVTSRSSFSPRHRLARARA